MECTELKWNSGYSVGIEAIDVQHRKLLEVINSLCSIIEDPDLQKVVPVLRDLVLFTREHFQTEESLLKKNNYPYYSEHKHEHDHFIAKVILFLKEHSENKNNLSKEIFIFLKEWFDHHLLIADQKYKDFLNK